MPKPQRDTSPTWFIPYVVEAVEAKYFTSLRVAEEQAKSASAAPRLKPARRRKPAHAKKG